jgi:transcriptional regulator with XRE-family HTH domain
MKTESGSTANNLNEIVVKVVMHDNDENQAPVLSKESTRDSMAKINDNNHLEQEQSLNPAAVVKDVQNTRKILELSIEKVADQCKIPNSTLLNILRADTAKWESLTFVMKMHYIKLNAWCEMHRKNDEANKISMSPTVLARKIKALLDRLGMSVSNLAKQIDSDRTSISALLEEPQPWDTLIETKRVNMRKLNAWFAENKEDTDGEELAQDDFNVEELVVSVRGLCLRIGLPFKECGVRLGMCSSTFFDLINYPGTWETMSGVVKNHYRKLNEWYERTMADVASGKVEFNTREFARQVDSLLIRLGMTVSELSGFLGIVNLINMIRNPQPWSKLSDKEKSEHLILNKWFVEKNKLEKESAAADENVLDTRELSEKVRGLLERLGMSIKEVAMKLDINRNVLTNLLNFPEPWDFLGDARKNHYRRLNAWFVKNKSNKGAKSVKRLGCGEKTKKKKQTQTRMVGQSGSVELDTGDVAKKVLESLEKHGISCHYFSDLKMHITKGYFNRLVTEPPPWRELSLGEKVLFNKMQTWTESSQVEIDAFKQKCHSHKS